MFQAWDIGHSGHIISILVWWVFCPQEPIAAYQCLLTVSAQNPRQMGKLAFSYQYNHQFVIVLNVIMLNAIMLHVFKLHAVVALGHRTQMLWKQHNLLTYFLSLFFKMFVPLSQISVPLDQVEYIRLVATDLSRWQCHKHFTHVTYGHSKIS
jgi:hypothetical protein